MRSNIEKRIEQLESANKSFSNMNFAILTTYVAPGHINRPVAGWAFGDWENNRIEVLRLEGEDDDSLARRAVSLCREHFPACVPDLVSVFR